MSALLMLSQINPLDWIPVSSVVHVELFNNYYTVVYVDEVGERKQKRKPKTDFLATQIVQYDIEVIKVN